MPASFSIEMVAAIVLVILALYTYILAFIYERKDYTYIYPEDLKVHGTVFLVLLVLLILWIVLRNFGIL